MGKAHPAASIKASMASTDGALRMQPSVKPLKPPSGNTLGRRLYTAGAHEKTLFATIPVALCRRRLVGGKG
jgi:hypothetical protein